MKRIYVKEEVCIGCHLCEVYCQLQHANSKDIIKAFKKGSPRPLPRVRVEQNGVVSLSVRCQQCDEPQCVYACLTGALTIDTERGLVVLDEKKCIGCGTCVLVCPFGALKRTSNNEHTVKCDMCEGADMPVCVVNCPNEALVYVNTPSGR